MGWKRRSSAGSFSMFLRYSSSVVAPMHCSSPRASAGLSMLLASIAPSAAPAPTTVCSSSRNSTIWPLRLADLVHDALQALLELAPELGAGHQRAHVQRQQAPPAQVLRHVALGDLEGQPLGDGRLADAGVADQHRVVLGAPGQNLDGALDFLVAPDHRVNLVFPRQLGQVAREPLQHPVLFFGPLVGHARVAADLLQGPVDLLLVHAVVLEDAGRAAVGLLDQPQQQMLDADVAVLQAPRLLARPVQRRASGAASCRSARWRRCTALWGRGPARPRRSASAPWCPRSAFAAPARPARRSVPASPGADAPCPVAYACSAP